MKFINTLIKVIAIIIAIFLVVTFALTALLIIGGFILLGIIYAYFKNRYSNTIRRKDDTLYMPVVEFNHPQTKKRISFLGCIHIGNSSYYKTLEHFIQLHPNALVMCEGVKESFHDTDEKKATKDYALIASVIGVVSQYTMQYDEDWVFNDLPVEKMKQLSNIMMGIKGKGGKTLREVLNDADEKKRKMYASVFTFSLLNMNFFRFLLFFKKKKWREKVINHHIVHVRNHRAIEMVDPYLSDNDHIILLWGAGHLPGMKKLLYKRGFTQQSVKWIPAFSKPVSN